MTRKDAGTRPHTPAASSTAHEEAERQTKKRRAPTRIPIDNKYAIGADAHSWHILERRRYKDDYRWEPVSWHVNLEQCVSGLAQRAVRTCGAQTLSQALAEAERVTSAIRRALQPSFKVERR
jgi:hypothetical protein